MGVPMKMHIRKPTTGIIRVCWINNAKFPTLRLWNQPYGKNTTASARILVKWVKTIRFPSCTTATVGMFGSLCQIATVPKA